MSNQTEWRWADPAGQQRLVREDELRAALKSGVIPANAPVWTRGFREWRPAHDVPELSRSPAPPPTNGTNDIPPPPNFVVAGPAEPPPPPRYVPVAANTQPTFATEATSDAFIEVIEPAPAKPRSKPPPLPQSKTPPPLPVRVQSAKPPATVPTKSPLAKTTPLAKKPPIATKPPVAPSPAAPPAAPSVLKAATKPYAAQPSTFKQTQRPPMGVAPPSEELPPSGRHTLQVAPAPPPLPRLDPLPVAATPRSITKPVPQTPAHEPSSKHPTLMMFGGEDSLSQQPSLQQPQAEAEGSAPIVVPPNEPSAVTNAVTRPPPWGEGAVEMDTQIPKSPGVPSVGNDRPSEAPRPVELSSSDLSSEARIAVVKAPPLAPAERPHPTMLGLGPDALAQNRAALERAVRSPPPPPLSASDVASTSKWVPPPTQTQPLLPSSSPPPPRQRPPSSGARLHDLRAIAQERVHGAKALALRAWATLEDRTRDKPRWFLPSVVGAAALIVLILFAAGVKAVVGSVEPSPSASGSARNVRVTTTTTTTTTATAPPHVPARPMACQTSGQAHVVAPKALVASGVEVAAVGSQVALGFAVAPKEATLEVLDPQASASTTALHLRATDNVRRVVALDASKAIVDGDHKGDTLQGRRTVRLSPPSPPIDLGAMDGGLAWAPHGSDKGIKLWTLVSDAPVEALRAEPMQNGSIAVAFRQSGAIWFGIFGGSPPAPIGGLTHIAGLGPQIGSPSIASSGDRFMVAWADRASASDPWSIRHVIVKPGDVAAPQAKAFALPAGGLGEQAMSPGVASLGSGRFLLVWTEGAVSNHQVRGAVLDEGVATSAFTASEEGVNAGQGQAVVLPDGRGVVAFLAASQTGKGFEVAVTPIQCAEK